MADLEEDSMAMLLSPLFAAQDKWSSAFLYPRKRGQAQSSTESAL